MKEEGAKEEGAKEESAKEGIETCARPGFCIGVGGGWKRMIGRVVHV